MGKSISRNRSNQEQHRVAGGMSSNKRPDRGFSWIVLIASFVSLKNIIIT